MAFSGERGEEREKPQVYYVVYGGGKGEREALLPLFLHLLYVGTLLRLASVCPHPGSRCRRRGCPRVKCLPSHPPLAAPSSNSFNGEEGLT